MPKSNKLLSTDHSHSHSNFLFLLIVFIHFHIIFFIFFICSQNPPRDGQKHPQVTSWEPLGLLFGTPGGAFWHLWGCFLAPRGGQTHPHAHALLFAPILRRFGSPKASQKDPFWHPFSIQNPSQNDVQKRYRKSIKCC